MGTAQAIIGILAAGGGAFLLAVFQGFRDMRAGARAGHRQTIADLQQWRRECEADRDYWRDLVARRGWQCRQAGVEPVDPDPVPPSERRVSLKRRRWSRAPSEEG